MTTLLRLTSKAFHRKPNFVVCPSMQSLQPNYQRVSQGQALAKTKDRDQLLTTSEPLRLTLTYSQIHRKSWANTLRMLNEESVTVKARFCKMVIAKRGCIKEITQTMSP